MRQLQRERRDVWFARYEGKEPIVDNDGFLTGEYRLSYGKPFKLRPTASPRRGNTWGDGFGIGVDCDRTIVLNEVGTGIDESCVCWVDKAPLLDEDGLIEVDDTGDMAVPNDYRVVMVAESYNFTSIAIKKVE